MTGHVKEVDDYAVIIAVPTRTDATLDTFIAFEDIRGVETEGVDAELK